MATAGGKGEVLTSASTLPADEWSHVAGTLNPEGIVRVCINGKSDGEKQLNGKIKFGAWFNAISIGTFGKYYGYPYSGDLAAIRWWSRAATDAELATAAGRGAP